MSQSANEITLGTATLAGGCFWCIESAFNSVQGISAAISGYMGGDTIDPTYKEVCEGNTGHAEVVQLTFDKTTISYQEILEIFFSLHNPTQLNRQGNDIGTQYRTEIFYHDEEQAATANKMINDIQKQDLFDAPVVTKVSPVEVFYSGEEYHQEYFKNNPENQYCQAVVSPKLAKFRKTFIAKLKA